MQDFKGRQVRLSTGNVQPGPAQKPGQNARQPLAEPTRQTPITQDSVLGRLENLGVDVAYFRLCFAYRWLDYNTLARRIDALEATGLDGQSIAFAFSYVAQRNSFLTLKHDTQFRGFSSALLKLKEIGCNDKEIGFLMKDFDCMFLRLRDDWRSYEGLPVGSIPTTLLLQKIDELIDMGGPEKTREMLLAIDETSNIGRFLIDECYQKAIWRIFTAYVRLEQAKKHPAYPLVSSLGFSDETDVRILECYPQGHWPDAVERNIRFLAEQTSKMGKAGLKLLEGKVIASMQRGKTTGKETIFGGSVQVLVVLCDNARQRDCCSSALYNSGLGDLGFSPTESMRINEQLGAKADESQVHDNLRTITGLGNDWCPDQRRLFRQIILQDPMILTDADRLLDVLTSINEATIPATTARIAVSEDCRIQAIFNAMLAATYGEVDRAVLCMAADKIGFFIAEYLDYLLKPMGKRGHFAQQQRVGSFEEKYESQDASCSGWRIFGANAGSSGRLFICVNVPESKIILGGTYSAHDVSSKAMATFDHRRVKQAVAIKPNPSVLDGAGFDFGITAEANGNGNGNFKSR